jgi:beta-glucosidase
MATASFHFPQGFLWGCATSSYQVEGNITNANWSRWEETSPKMLPGQRSGKACDWWNGRWQEDFDHAAETGQNAHRLSIEWSRIQPEPDRWDEDALAYYHDILQGAINRGLTPMVTLHHFTDPLWVTERGGWAAKEIPTLFAAYAQKVVDALKDLCSLWVTINEPNVLCFSGYVDTVFPPGTPDLGLAAEVYANLIRGHAAAYRVIHDLQPNARVGIALNYHSLKPLRPWLGPDVWMASFQSHIFNAAFLDTLQTGKLNLVLKRFDIPQATGTQDFVGINYYSRDLVAFDLSRKGDAFSRRMMPPGAPLSPNGFIAHVPEGMFEALKFATRYGKDILVTENGVEDAADTLRPRYLVEHLHQVWRAANFNFRIGGYFHWSLVDNFEWERGWTQRFGLWGLDVETQERIRRPSVDLYAAICRENGITSEIVAQYAPESLGILFPG